MSNYRRLQVDVVGNVSGFLAAMNQANLGTSRFSQGMRTGQREAGIFQKQLLAIGTTARYALAGQLVFGITGAIQRLSDFKTQLGTIDAVAGQVDQRGHFRSMGSQLNQVGEEALLLSNKLGIAATDVESYMQRFYSSFNVPPGTRGLREMEGFVNRVAMLQAQFGAEAGDPQQLAGGVAGLIHNMPGGTRDIAGNSRLVANLISNLVSTTPNITGRDVARDIGRVGATMNIARMTPQQAFAAWGLAGMAGGSSSVIGRGMTQLLGTSLLRPQSPAQQQEFRNAGLSTDPTTLRQLGGWQVLMHLLRYVAPRGARIGNPGVLRDDQDVADPWAAVQASRARGINLTAIYRLFGRQESVRQFVNLLGQGGVQALQKYIDTQNKATRADQQRERFNAAIQQQTLRRFTMARQNISMSLVGGLSWPLEHLLANPVIGLSNIAARHPRATAGIVGGGFGLAATNQLRKLGVFGGAARAASGARGLGRFGRLLGLASNIETGAVSQAIQKEELPAAIAGQVADGTRANPFWVIISPLSQAVGGIPSTGFGPGTGPPPPGGKSIWNRIGRVAKWAGGGGAAAGRALGLAGGATVAGIAAIPEAWQLIYDLLEGGGREVPKGHPFLSGFGDPRRASSIGLQRQPTKLENNILQRFASGGLSADEAERRLAAIESLGPKRRGEVTQVQVQGTAKGEFTVKLVDEHGRTITTVREKGVPVKLWGANQVPTNKGRPGRRTVK